MSTLTDAYDTIEDFLKRLDNSYPDVEIEGVAKPPTKRLQPGQAMEDPASAPKSMFKEIITLPDKDIINIIKITTSKEWVEYTKADMGIDKDDDLAYAQFSARFHEAVLLYRVRCSFRLYIRMNVSMMHMKLADINHDYVRDGLPGEEEVPTMSASLKLVLTSAARTEQASIRPDPRRAKKQWLIQQCALNEDGTPSTEHGPFLLHHLGILPLGASIPAPDALDDLIKSMDILWPLYYPDTALLQPDKDKPNKQRIYVPPLESDLRMKVMSFVDYLKAMSEERLANMFLTMQDSVMDYRTGKTSVATAYDTTACPSLVGKLQYDWSGAYYNTFTPCCQH